MSRAFLVLLATSACLPLVAAPARASFPGRNGAIAYASAPFDTGAGAIGKGALRTLGPGKVPDTLFLDNPKTDEFGPSYAPDGQTLVWAVLSGDEKTDGVYVGPAGGGPGRQLVASSYVDGPSWSPDGLRVVYSDLVEGLKVVPAAGGPATILVPARAQTILGSPSFSHDGTQVLYTRAVSNDKVSKIRSELWTVGVDGSGARKLLGKSKGALQNVLQPDLSPDGTKIAFVANGTRSTDRSILFVANATGSGARAIVKAPANGAFNGPVWSPDGGSVLVSRLRSTASRGSATLLSYAVATKKQTVVRSSPRGFMVDPSWQALR